MQIFNPQIGFL